MEVHVERGLSALETMLLPLPGRVRAWVEIRAGAAWRGVW
jgi:hypothetical protein